MRYPHLAPLLVVILVAAAAGCSDDKTTSAASSSSSGAGGTDLAKNCAARCEAKASECGAPTAPCGDLCADATEAEVACVEAATCSALARSEGRCPEGSSGSGGSSGSSGSAGGKPGEACVDGKCESGTCLTQYSPALCSKTCKAGTNSDCPPSLPVCKDPLNSGTGSCQK